ncbi:MAG: hypothetical protein K6U00_08255 [Armatimonadetes bacterium]|nr:hypothetical protein [Armatimonadota bacterium]
MQKLSKHWHMMLLLATLLMVPARAGHYDPNQETFTFFAWRSLGYWLNNAPHVKVKSFLGTDGTPSVGETGQAEQGWHELHPLPGPQTATFEDNGDAYPTVAGPVIVGHKPEEWAVFDIPIYWTYEADNLVWGQSFVRMGQTFKATGREIDKVSVQLPHEVDDLMAVVRSGGPSGKQIGPVARFTDGPGGDGTRFGWYIARWKPGDVPLERGKTYYIELYRKSGKPFAMRLHSTGDVYPDGCAYFEGKKETCSDLGLFISEARDDMLRSPVIDSNDENWVLNTTGVYFIARTANIRTIFSQIAFENTPFHIDAVFRVYKVNPDGTKVRVGAEKVGYNYTRPGTEHYVAAVYAADEMPLEIGQKYFVEIIPKDKELPADESLLPKRNLNVRIYGEMIAGMTPVIYNQHIVNTTSNSIMLAWAGTEDADTKVLYGSSPYKPDKVIRVPTGVNQVEISSLRPGQTVSFRIVKSTKAGGKFETPVYQARTLDAQGQVVNEPPLLAPPKHEFLDMCIGFLNLATMDRIYQPPVPDVRNGKEIPIVNPSFERGLSGWQIEGMKNVTTLVGLSKSGKASIGWDLSFSRHEGDYDRKDTVYQKVRVTPGKTYLLSASLYTRQEGHSDNWYDRFNWGDVRARLVCDPKAGTDFSGHNSTQWFCTDGRWLKFAKKWKAETDTITIGVGFYRRTDWQRVLALADDIRLIELPD